MARSPAVRPPRGGQARAQATAWASAAGSRELAAQQQAAACRGKAPLAARGRTAGWARCTGSTSRCASRWDVYVF